MSECWPKAWHTKVTFLFALAMLSTSGTSAAERDKRLSAQFYDCIAKSTSYEAKAPCYSAEGALQKKRLNAAYSRIAGHADPAEVASLDQAQKAWIAWRDKTAGYLGEHAGEVGSTNLIITENFVLQAIIDQTDLLNRVADSKGW
jgi:uncharacterized protein YecT (DUF1311 family)